MRKTIKSLWICGISIILCVAMLAGSTFAWFTDSVESGGNQIVAGNLDIEMYWTKDLTSGNWINAEDENSERVFDYENWEPGYTEVRYVKIVNSGSLAFKYALSIIADGELGSLANVIDVYFVEAPETNIPGRETLKAMTPVGTLTEAIMGQIPANGVLLPAGEVSNKYYSGEIVVAIALKMRENAGNEYMGESVGDSFSLKLNATQFDYENDAFGSDYDKNAQWPVLAPGETFTATTTVTPNAEGKVGVDTTVGNTNGDIYAYVPAAVKMADGANALKLTVGALSETESNVTATNRSEVLRSVDVHIDGVADDNTVPMAITLNAILPTGLNKNNVKLYHVEDGATVEMTLVDAPVNHNEFSYDPATGNVIMTIASFSEIVVYGDTKSEWDGKTVDTSWYNKDATTLYIDNAESLVGFRDLVDSGITFEGQTVILNSNINLNNHNFDPIGWGYEYDGFTEDGKTFNGTFDGDNHTIFGLYQNGWEANDCDNKYDYSMAGGGLFASVCDATIKNLTISGADIVMECIDMGVVAGYAQGKCTFDNIAIVNCTIQNYNRYTGGVVGEVSPRYDANGNPVEYKIDETTTVKGGYHVFNNIRVDSTTVVSSLWGSFDTSLGGILGGKWDKNGAETKVVMTNCDVACTIDAFNDVTSAYQWYAYRRAGMLIGNTEQSADHKALANFLTCENVHVYYGEWNNYHYCEFTNQSGSDDAAWQNNYPWVRVESGLSCGAYSNPRYGHPIVNGIAIADSIHGHAGDDECMVSIPFKQLYGGGQGVYGATEHTGVSEGAYTVTYISYGETVKVEFVADNTKTHTLWDVKNHTVGTSNPEYWETGHGEKVTSIPVGNTVNYIVYPKWVNEYTIRFHDAEGNMLYHEHFKASSSYEIKKAEIEAALNALQTKIDANKKVIIISWDIEKAKEDYKKDTGKNLTFKNNTETVDNIDFSKVTSDITIHAKYNLSTSSIILEPVYENEVLTHYKVVDVADETIENVVIAIPPRVGTVPVASLGENAFAGFDNLHAVVIPSYIKHIGVGALAENWKNGTFGSDKGETITIYYQGTKEKWDAIKKDAGWYYGVSANTRIFFLDQNNKVDYSQGYLQFEVTGSNWLGAVKDGKFNHVATIPTSFVSDYTKVCDCKIDNCHGKIRPDAIYWIAE